MNDLDRLLAFLHAAGYERTEHDDAYRYIQGRTYYRGYSGFHCDFYFSEDGRLIDHGCWE